MPLSIAGLSLNDSEASDCFPGCTGNELFLDEESGLEALDNDAYWDHLERQVELGEDGTPPADIYQPLEEWQTRVLAIEPGAYGQTLEASLHNVDLLHDPGALIHGTKERIEYDALSYCWGNPERCRLLLCNGHRCAITREAYRALQRLRSPTARTYIWLDAVCINQADKLEKSQQVRKMLSIYKKATCVYVWLGEHRGASTLVVKRLAEMSVENLPGDRISQHDSHDNLALKVREGSQICPTHIAMVASEFEKLIARPWFERVWVMQELWAARADSVQVVVGEDKFSWQKLVLLTTHNTRASDKDFIMSDRDLETNPSSWLAMKARSIITGDPLTWTMAETKELPNARLDDHSKHNLDIVNVLRRSVGRSCSMPQDHVYGLLGMSSAKVRSSELPDHHDGILLDYERSPRQVFEDFARHVIRRDQCLTVLYLDGLCYRQGVPKDESNTAILLPDLALPSWVPDLRRPLGPTRCLFEEVSQYDEFRLLLRYPISTKISVREQTDDGVLRLRGLHLGVVESFHGNKGYFHYPEARQQPIINTLQFRYQQVREAEHHIAADRNRWKGGILDHTDSPITSVNSHSREIECLKAWSTFIQDTEHTWLWQMPPNAEVGDIVVVAEGARTPLLLRSSTAGHTYRYIGPVLVPEGGEIRYEPSAQVNSIALCLADIFADCLRDGMLEALDVV